MDIIIEGIEEAFRLIFSRDREVFEVVFLSLRVSLVSLLIAGSAGIPLGIWMAKHRFVLKHFLMRLIYTLMGMPPVLCGLVVYIIFMRRGPLGSLKLNYTVTVMIVAQTLLILPIILGLTMDAAREKQKRIQMLAKTLGADGPQTLRLFIFELRFGLITALVSGFSRAISEVGRRHDRRRKYRREDPGDDDLYFPVEGDGGIRKGGGRRNPFTADFFCDEFGALSFPEGKES